MDDLRTKSYLREYLISEGALWRSPGGVIAAMSLFKLSWDGWFLPTLVIISMAVLSHLFIVQPGWGYAFVASIVSMLVLASLDSLSVGQIAHNNELFKAHVRAKKLTRHINAIKRKILKPRLKRGVTDIDIGEFDVIYVDAQTNIVWIKGAWKAQWPVKYFDDAYTEHGDFWIQLRYIKHPWGWWLEKQVKLEWRSFDFESMAELQNIPEGTFLMGSDVSENEQPIHQRQVDAFSISAVPVTERVYAMVMAEKPSQSLLPKVDVSWFDAVQCLNQWSELAGRRPVYKLTSRSVTWNDKSDGFRLPTEAEWEYACRAGSNTLYWWGDEFEAANDYAWHYGNSAGKRQVVKQKICNTWGLYDMAGNVSEWCWSPRTDNYEGVSSVDLVVRGGAFNNSDLNLRSALRYWGPPGGRDWSVGFRCVSVSSQAYGLSKNSSLND